MNHKNIAIITARGGSKRIPGKNIKDFCGKPIMAYSIEAALQSGIFSEVMVSTDSEEIAKVARTYGAKVPFMRSAQTASDYATTAQVLLEVLSVYAKQGDTFDMMACIYPTAPFVTAEKLQEAYQIWQQEDVSAIIPVVPFSYPPQRGYVVRESRLQMKEPQYRDSRSQDLETIYHDSGQFYFYNAKEYVETQGVHKKGIYPFVLSELEVQDIDNETDWKLAECKYRFLQERK